MKKIINPLIILLILVLCFTIFVGAVGNTSAPIAENLELSTFRGVSVGGKLSAVDPDGSEMTYEITTEPVKGTIELEEDGHFVYTPSDGKRGKDYFGYKAIDADGNYSQEATVIIRIEKQKSKVTYSDMNDKSGEFAALTLAEQGIFIGENLAGSYVFSPETPVTRGEFLAMCMKAADVEVLTGVTSTGFADDGDIAAWAKPYVSTALKCGIITGYNSEADVMVFSAEQCISVTEAAVMMNKIFGFTNVVSSWAEYEEAVPAWAAQSTANLEACNIMPYGVSVLGERLTRAQAAEMLVNAMDVAAGR